MHHLKHIRKRAYTVIPPSDYIEQIQALRNRKQVPLCEVCHNAVHQGKYSGPALKAFSPRVTLYDNRIVHIESFVKKGPERYAKNLEEKGWVTTDKQERPQEVNMEELWNLETDADNAIEGR